MNKTIVAVNAGPRKGRNTATLITEAAKGAQSAGAQVLVSGDTLQLTDYGKTDWPWTMFDPEEKIRRHETVFPLECEKAFHMGAALAGQSMK